MPLGGFRGVVLTDIIQFVLLLFSALVVFVVAFSKSRGWATIAQSAEVHNKTQYMSIGARGFQVFYLCHYLWLCLDYSGKRVATAFSYKKRNRCQKNDCYELFCLYTLISYSCFYRHGSTGSV
ncbi:MAG: hypothetical protein IAA16_01760 [Candidatus Treponema excrementipullorum]|uniref:Uncharacterized protein n=1 Tax=Candidatus Treponema excrementipullorum TaxID=2838768 RepID=A0A9E2NY53_9SPIR|nr:hypothetical protein [Candidatus Treponema excrementipullorum]